MAAPAGTAPRTHPDPSTTPRRGAGGPARPRRLAAVLALALALSAAACSGGGSGGGEEGTLRLGYFPNLTHATALVGIERGSFQRQLGAVRLETRSFGAGPAATEALLSGAVDATYIGPNPAINAFVKSKGAAIRIISGATSGGAFLVVKPDIRSAADLKGRKLATPQLGNTQDVALRSWLDKQGLRTTPEGGGDVRIVPQENSQTLETFQSGGIDGAWVPEPWATRLQQEGGGKVLVNEADLWPGGQFVTTQLVVRTAYLADHPANVRALISGLLDAI
ncbi:MAG TPA: ABC transporter substrate-binding protein, partial [Actinomycetes bacterium]|nr:ABC transporter substrate-binding protein [Actinomycetes bacterium]